MKKYFLILIAIVMIASIIVGCAPTTPTTTTTTNVTTTTNQTTKPSESTTAAMKPVEISFLHWRNEDKDAYAKIYEKFKLIEPNITIVEEILPGPEQRNVLNTRLAGGAAPDLFGINGIETWGPRYNSAEYLEYLNDIDELDQVPENFMVGSIDKNGNIYAAPWNIGNYAMFYNVDIFNENNIEVPKNWNEFLDVCNILKDNGITPISVGGKDVYTLYWLEQLIAVNDQYTKDPESFVKINQRQAKFSELDSFKSTLEKFSSLINDGIITELSLGLTYADSITLFSQEKAAMLAAGCFTTQGILNANPNININVMPIPGDNGESNFMGVKGMVYAISKTSSDDAKEAAKRLIRFMFDKEVMREYSESTGLFPTVKGVEANFSNIALKTFFEKSVDGTLMVTFFDPDVVSATFNAEFFSMLQGLVANRTSIDQILADTDALIIP